MVTSKQVVQVCQHGCRSTRTLTKSYHANSYPSQLVPNTNLYLLPKPSRIQYQLVPKLTILSYCCYVMYNTRTQHNIAGRSEYIISGVYPYLQMAQVSHGHFFGRGERKNTRQLKQILNVITCTTVNISFTRLPINFRLLFSIIV